MPMFFANTPKTCIGRDAGCGLSGAAVPRHVSAQVDAVCDERLPPASALEKIVTNAFSASADSAVFLDPENPG